MKDLVISARRIRREIRFAAAAFIVAFLTNLYAVVRFDRPWYELFTQMGYVVVITAVIYLLLWIPRLARGARFAYGRPPRMTFAFFEGSLSGLTSRNPRKISNFG